MKYKYTDEYKMIFLFYKKGCTYNEISELLNIPLLIVSQTIAVEQCEIKKQIFQSSAKNNGKVKLN